MNKLNFYDSLNAYKRNKTQKDELMHYGIIGQKWGQRRWQNADGTFNEEGKIRYFGKNGTTKKSSDEEKIGSKDQKIGGYIEEATRLAIQDVRIRERMSKDTLNEISEGFDDPDAVKNAVIKNQKIANKMIDAIENGKYKKYMKLRNKIDDDFEKDMIEEYANKMADKVKNQYAEYLVNNAVDQWNNSYDQKVGSEYTKNLKKIIPEYDDIDDEELKELIDMEMFDMKSEYDSGKSIEELSKEHGYKKENIKSIIDYMNNDGFEDYAEENTDKIDKIINNYGFDENNMSKDEWDAVNNTLRSEYYKSLDADQKVGGLFDSKEEKEAKKLAKEAEKLEKEFLTQSPYDKNYKYLDGDKIDKWLDKEENKAVEKAYADAMNTAFGDTSKELHELFKDYDNNRDKYIAKAAICDSLDWYNNLGDISSEVRWFIGDDGDQGSRNSHAYYLNTKGYDEKQIDKKFWEANEKLNEGYEVGRKLSQYYNPVIPNMSEKLQKELYNRINYRWEKSDNYSYNKLLEASEGGEFNKDHMKIADNFEKKLKPSCSDKNGDGWWFFNQAVRNLGMEGLNYKDMTQSDWNELNAEINRLKK